MLKNSIYRNVLGQTDTHLLLTIMSLEITSANSYFFSFWTAKGDNNSEK